MDAAANHKMIQDLHGAYTATAQRDGRSLNMLGASTYEFVDGVVAEMRVLPFDGQEWQLFWA
jgi:hypothetical protein